ncbi:hypothetical protein [Mesobacillus sp. S13]|uniref:hypothetical protein n=1 Tax=Mesobacillus sp. S13 TaxID=2880221 RepID=UPI001CF5CAD6|nr:hypothetical protein [Mesobacillus sp. S13]
MMDKLKRWEANDNINLIQGQIDLVIDEYGNYYTPYTTTTVGMKLTEVVLCHEIYNIAFSWLFIQDDWQKEYKYSHLGEPMVEGLNGQISDLKHADRKIFSIQDLLENGTKVSFYDITSFKTRNKNKS